MEKMRAVLIQEPTAGKDLKLSLMPIPQVRPGWVLVRVKAFGLNHSEQILRQAEIRADYIRKPIVPGIECAGEVADPSDSPLHLGQKVMAMMGGMGRSFHGSYAEYALLPVSHVFPVESDLSWERLAAMPETYYTAWGSLFQCLNLNEKDTLLVRGGTCALGYAALKLAGALGCRAIATTHRKEKLSLLDGADEAVLDDGQLAGRIDGVTKILDLVGPKYLKDSLRTVRRGGIVCNTGILGGVYSLNGFDPIKDIPNGVYLTGFFSNSPTQTDVDQIMAFSNRHHITPDIGGLFDFSRIHEAGKAQDEGSVNGKIVVRIEEEGERQ